MIRPERPDNAAAISALLAAAFGGADEARLVERLRADGDLAASLVAEEAGAVAGHAALSPLAVADRPDLRLAALAPVAVRAESRRRGLGAALCRAAVEAARRGGFHGVVVLGDPAYYGRFGFAPEAAAGLRCPWSGPHLQALVFPGAPGPFAGALRYAAAFRG